ncbi:MAG: twin-arginine translocation signal domain-containing protein [Gemmataceae bacterium]|nr:twin-arginine translocation signal domain-containing protein [Gemmataceae bacterium]MCI0740643.1 twin-arginine translocation signal domain-containing protein [Gemmataceae bacterium]
MAPNSRREFLKQVGSAVVAASVGSTLADDLGFSTAFASQGSDELTFGRLEPLVALMQETPANRLLPLLHERLRQGTELRDLVSAAALANARSCGGEDYVGFHTIMAMAPAWHMSAEMPEDRRALPVFKVLYRNTSRIQERGGRSNEVLRVVQPAAGNGHTPENLRQQARERNADAAERTFAALAQGGPDDALNAVLWVVEDGTDVHRVVLPYRSWDLLGVIGREQAHTLLRQSVRYGVRNESPNYATHCGPVRQIVPRLLDQHRLVGRQLGTRTADDRWVEEFSMTIFRATAEGAAEAVAAALAEGFPPAAIGEAMALAANQLVLRDSGRPQNQAQPNRGLGSVHGDSIGVHSCDAVNAWRNLARAANPRNQVVCLILGGYQAAQDRAQRGGDFLNWQPYPHAEARERMQAREQDALLRETEDAIRNRDQMRACAATHRYGELGHPARAMFDLLLKYAVSEDGALHAEKFYRTTSEEYASLRPAFRWRQVVALARVTASAYGQAAPGHDEACRLLRVS